MSRHHLRIALHIVAFGFLIPFTVSQTRPIDYETEAATPITLDSTSTLDDYLAYAALNNAGLHAAFEKWKAALEAVRQADVLPDPKFNYGYFIRNVETRVGAQSQRFGISQTFPWLGKLKLKEEASMAMANMAQQQYESAKVQLFDELKQSYFDYYYLGKAIEITAENVELLKEFERIARSKYESGSALYADLLKAQVELDKTVDRLKTLQEQTPPMVARLNAVLSRPPSSPLRQPTSIPRYNSPPDVNRLLIELAENNPDLRTIDYLKEREQANLELAKKEFYPNLTFGLDIVDTTEAILPGVTDSGKDAVMLGFSANLPIWRKKLKANVVEAERLHLSAARSRIDMENQLGASLELAVFKFQDAERKIELYRDSLIGKAEQNLTVTRSAFEAGKVDFLSLIDAERALLEFKLNHEQATADREKAISSIERIIGKSLP